MKHIAFSSIELADDPNGLVVVFRLQHPARGQLREFMGDVITR